MVDVNAGTALWLTQAVAPYMRERGSGAIVHAPEAVADTIVYLVSDAAAPISGAVVPTYGA